MTTTLVTMVCLNITTEFYSRYVFVWQRCCQFSTACTDICARTSVLIKDLVKIASATVTIASIWTV